MAANTTPIFTITPVYDECLVTTANTAMDGSGTMVDLIAGTVNGTRVDRIVFQALATTVAGLLRLFIYDSVAGTTRLIQEVPVTVITASTTVAAWSQVIEFSRGLILPSTSTIRVSTSVTNTFAVTAFGGAY